MLSEGAQKILNDYFNLPFDGIEGVRCPYFNNARLKQRAQLRVLVGKGTPKEIVEESKIISIQYHAGLFDKSGHCCLHNEHTGEKITADQVRKFLIDHNLGIECSGFVTQILKVHFKESKNIDITRKFFITSPRRFFRWLIAKLRPIENISVCRYADDRNTKKINWQEAGSGDVIVILSIGRKNAHDHILIITENKDNIIHYAHARAWGSEGKYGHGVSVGQIKISKLDGSLLDQEWSELDKTGEANETLREMKQAKVVEVRRLIF